LYEIPKGLAYLAGMRELFLCVTLLWAMSGYAQQPFIRLVQPLRTAVSVGVSQQYISGSTCVGCAVSVQGKLVKVYPTGAFVAALKLNYGDTAITIEASKDGKSVQRVIQYSFPKPSSPQPVQGLAITSIQITPEEDVVLAPGDEVQFRVKALPRSRVWVDGRIELRELPLTAKQQMPGIYEGRYRITANDTIQKQKWMIRLTDSTGKSVTRESSSFVQTTNSSLIQTIQTKGRLAHLLYGLGEDRLGGAKMGYIDSNILLRTTGKQGGLYRVQLTPNRVAYIPDDVVQVSTLAMPVQPALSGKITVRGGNRWDEVAMQINQRVSYFSQQELYPSRLVVDLFGVQNNTNWITHFQERQAIDWVHYEQVDEQVLRLIIYLKQDAHWGHRIFYRGNQLIIQVKQQPPLDLSKLVIGVDAGHGGSNPGGVGPTNSVEKELCLAVSLKLEAALKKVGARVIMSRRKEQFFDNKERILFYRDSVPDLLVSVHLNSSENPIDVRGTSVYYRYPGSRAFASSLYEQLLGLGLPDYGLTGSFNFMLNSPTEYPNALLELLFLSHPEEETLILDPAFQQRVADSIVGGIQQYLQELRPQE
jgi:N-acetylmuramoyl-L-alanine amidase